MLRHKKLYQPKSLRDLAKRRIQEVYKNNWEQTKVLPTTLQHELLLAWLRCDETIPESNNELEKILKTMEDGWESMKPITSTMFLYLMRLPDEVPPFAADKNHVIWNYYEWHRGAHMTKLCSSCMGIKSKFYKPYSANLWLDNNWQFKRVEDHSVYDGEELLDKLIWNEDNWCSNCITEPLWEHILDSNDCFLDYNYHLRKKRPWEDSSSDEESDIEYRRVTNVVGNRMCPSMYSLHKKNKLLY